jgi:hypothetical protein
MIDKTVKVFKAKDKRQVIQMSREQKKWFYDHFVNDFLKCINGLKDKNNLPPSWNDNDESTLTLHKWVSHFNKGGYWMDPYHDAIYVKLKKCCDKIGFPFKDIWPFEIDSYDPTAKETRLHMDEWRKERDQYDLEQQGVKDSNFDQLFENV